MEKKKTESIKLFDLKKDNYPDQRGNTFRSKQIAECWICSALTNRVVMGGWPGYGVRMICPNSAEEWHHELEDKVTWLNHPHPEEYKNNLKGEIAEMKARFKHLVKNDLKGNVNLNDKNLRRSVSNTRSYKSTYNKNIREKLKKKHGLK